MLITLSIMTRLLVHCMDFSQRYLNVLVLALTLADASSFHSYIFFSD